VRGKRKEEARGVIDLKGWPIPGPSFSTTRRIEVTFSRFMTP
jgi:hypothetical protein